MDDDDDGAVRTYDCFTPHCRWMMGDLQWFYAPLVDEWVTEDLQLFYASL